ncbi:type IV pilin-like G/H family protein [Trichocoleus sp. ST-U3]|uniref:type IV pilin-like G/H family protein n=1 Tax=Coleofasciculus sp. FACHB-542 TaxID=2692787 RepID=UPI001685AC9E|nr:type IV pilin-like G/H family protein [Coleofasciculus sp. FACHB-542]MBD2087083.1 type IV pilin-like G/H family protein [Coleofasciculus sp. FACHB-542]
MMSIHFRAKWLHFLFKKHTNEGIAFYIGILILIIIFGVLAVMALPIFLNCANTANNKRSQGEIYIVSINRGQEAYYLENNTFVASLPKLGLSIPSKTKDYEYSIRATKTAVFNYAIAQETASEPLKSYVGAVFIVPDNHSRDLTTVRILCQANAPGAIKPVEPAYQNGEVACGSNTTKISRY